MDLFAITISITDNKDHVVLADQAHDEASSCRVELRFPLGTSPDRVLPTGKSRSSGTRVPSSLQP
jgi:hypothetical protein